MAISSLRDPFQIGADSGPASDGVTGAAVSAEEGRIVVRDGGRSAGDQKKGSECTTAPCRAAQRGLAPSHPGAKRRSGCTGGLWSLKQIRVANAIGGLAAGSRALRVQ